jgi:SAM-dependent methyltransferase
MSAARAHPDVFGDFERERLPFRDRTFQTVLCFDALEHVDNPHQLFDECARVAERYLVIALPNNWVGMLWSFVLGHNVTHQAGYGFPPEARAPGDRHKWFFNLEEAERFVTVRAQRAGFRVLEVRHVFERGNAGLVYVGPYPRILGTSVAGVRKHRPGLLLPFLVAKYAVALPLSWLEEIVKRVIWGWGQYRYANLFCRQVWLVLERQSDD